MTREATDPADDASTRPAGQAVLEVEGLTVTLGEQRIIEHLSFVVHRGEILTILGPNGAGKTVLLRTLLGVVPHEGRIRWAEGIRIGYVPQRLPYIKDVPISVEEFFTFKRRGRRERSSAATAAARLAAVGLGDELRQRRIGDLSSGQFQRVLIAWALAGDPDVLLFDEPTTGIDIGGEETVYKLLARLHDERRLTMLIITHDLSVVYALSTNVLCLNRSRVCHGPPRSVLTPENLRELYRTDVKFYEHQHG
jgi:zinc transport system ATP-binding protein